MRRRVALGAAAALTPLLLLAAWIAWPLPPGMTTPSIAPAIVVADRNGVPLRGTRAGDGTRSRWVSIGELDPDLITAFIAVEDRRFFEHGAIDWRAVARAARDDIRAGRIVSGASTLTMQTARLLAPGDRDVSGKLSQALWALRIERHLTKQQILEQYLNRIHLGQGTVGVAAAAALYFDASPADVSPAQAALLAGLAHAPASENPFASLARARHVRARAVNRMRADGFISEADARRALAEPLIARATGMPFLAPHFTTRVLRWADDSALASTPALGSSGVLRTSLDLQLQTAIEGEVRHTVDVLGDRGVREAATVVLDNQTGEILAWVGSPDFWADTAGQTDMVVSPRQPGSALKPFVYGLAFDRGLTAATVIPDIAKEYQTSIGLYRPRNYDHRFHGPVRIREALASSYNIPAVETTERLGAASVLATLRAAGFASLRESADWYGLGIALGNGDVTLLELANAYRALGNAGVWRPVRWRPAIGPTREPGRRVVSARSAAIVLDILSDAEARVPAFGVSTPFDFAFPVAVKTGTSRHFTDNWAVAVTGRFTVAVWVGNFNGRAMEGVSGITGAGPLLHRAVVETAKRYPPGAFTTPAAAGAVAVTICRLSGMRAGSECPTANEWFAPGTEPVADCDWHRDGSVTMPAAYSEWLAAERGAGVRVAASVAPAAAGFRIVSPLDGDRYSVPPSVDPRYSTIALRATGETSRVRWSVDGKPFAADRLPLIPGGHLIRATSNGIEREVRIVVAGGEGSR
ncbi:MAG: penicillin-binding protein 1C [Gemmatimonadaceae bacterium]